MSNLLKITGHGLASNLEAAMGLRLSRGLEWKVAKEQGTRRGLRSLWELAALGRKQDENAFGGIAGLAKRVNRMLYEGQNARVQAFRQILETGGLKTEYYETDGNNIQGACGQLSYSFAAGGDA
jgi:hypothetical protein